MADFEHNGEEVKLEGLLVVDAIQFFPKIESIQCMNGSAFSYAEGIIPFGNVDHFLTKTQILQKYSCDYSDSQNCSESITNFVLNPIHSYFDPISAVTSDTMVEHKLDNLFNVESLGITEDSCASDEKIISDFKSKISFSDGKYHVELPWIEDKIALVRPNFEVCRSILHRVYEKMKSENLCEEYNNVFAEQLCAGVLEEVPMHDLVPENHIFIPHRAVIKTDEQCTTKFRVVLNCSLKIANTPSLNEAAFPGIDLLSRLFNLLLKSRSQRYAAMADIKKAFLMIKLSKECDRNRFSI